VVTGKNDAGNTVIDHALCAVRDVAKFWRDRATVLEHYFRILGALLIGNGGALLVAAADVKSFDERDVKIKATPTEDGGFVLQFDGALVVPASQAIVEVAAS